VRRLECETLLPVITPTPVKSHLRDIVSSLI
jgi:hypothetical protein